MEMTGHLKMEVGSGGKVLLNGTATLRYYTSGWKCPIYIYYEQTQYTCYTFLSVLTPTLVIYHTNFVISVILTSNNAIQYIRQIHTTQILAYLLGYSQYCKTCPHWMICISLENTPVYCKKRMLRVHGVLFEHGCMVA